jgi:hypothetical protein
MIDTALGVTTIRCVHLYTVGAEGCDPAVVYFAETRAAVQRCDAQEVVYRASDTSTLLPVLWSGFKHRLIPDTG